MKNPRSANATTNKRARQSAASNGETTTHWTADALTLVSKGGGGGGVGGASSLSLASLRSMLADMSTVELRDAVDNAVRELPEDRLRGLYSALVDGGGFDRILDAVHEHVKARLLGGRATIADVLRTFGCHPSMTLAVVAPLAQEILRRRDLEGDLYGDLDGDLDADQIARLIGGLEPGQCVLIACDGIIDEHTRRDDAFTDCFDNGVLICRVPTKRSFPRFKTPDKRRFKGAWRTLEMDPPLVPGGDTGRWLQWFIAGMVVQAAPDGDFPAAFALRMQNAGLCGVLDGTAEYLVMNFPSACCGGRSEMSARISDPSEWIGEEYSTNNGDFDEHDEPDAFCEEAWLYRTLDDAVRGLRNIELIAKASRRGQPAEVLFRSKFVDPNDDVIMLG